MQWPLSKRIAFRLLFIYLILYCLPLKASWLWNRLVFRMGTLIGVDATFRMNGSGDTTYNYVQVLCIFLVALTGALVWSIADRKRANYHRLYLGLRVFVRLFLGMTLIQYGSMKVIPAQFPPPGLHRLLQPFGDASPMGLLWTFMGASAPYNIFTGGIELIGGLLLFFPRTSLIGALISIGAMSQVGALNFCYDVPVKLFSLHLLGMAVFIAAADAGRLANLFLLNRSAPPGSSETVLQRRGLLHGVFALKILFLTAILGAALYNAHSQRNIEMRMLQDVDQAGFPLLNRGFHWVNESPYNH